MSKYLIKVGKNARKAFQKNSLLDKKKKNKVLDHFNKTLKKETKKILKENKKDVDIAKKK